MIPVPSVYFPGDGGADPSRLIMLEHVEECVDKGNSLTLHFTSGKIRTYFGDQASIIRGNLAYTHNLRQELIAATEQARQQASQLITPVNGRIQ